MNVSFCLPAIISQISYRLTYLLLLLCCVNLRAQDIVIKGQAHQSHVGKIIQLYTFSDYLTGLQQKETQDTVQQDGFFELSFQSNETQPVFLKIGNISGKLYVQPDFVYGITFPELDTKFDYKNDAELPVNLGVVGTDSTELNALIFDYEGLYTDFFTPEDGRFLSRTAMFKRADSLKLACDKRYKTIVNEYFRIYVEYSIASINASVSRGENFLINGYIIGKPIRYKQYEYMQFFNACFSGYLKTIASMRKGQSLYNIINVKADYQQLTEFLKEDKFLKNDTLRELVVIKNLWDFYFSAEFTPSAIESIISQLNQKTNITQHRKITGTMLAYFNKMQPGSMAPGFSARSKDGKVGTLASYKNRWVYLNFFSTNNPGTLKEMPKIAALKKKFGDKISFISICLDDSLKSYQDYVRINPKFDWAIWFNNDKSFTKTAKESYFVTGTEAYFLISNTGYLVQSPAPSPSQGIEYKLNTLFKTNKRNTKTGIR